MNVATTFATESRRAASPYARRLAREKDIALVDLTGRGPNGRITAADIFAHVAAVAARPPEQPVAAPVSSVVIFSAAVSLTDFYQLARDAERVGLTLGVVDVALRAARTAIATIEDLGKPQITLEADGKQILISRPDGLSIGAERRLRLDALEGGADVAEDPAIASLLVLQETRVIPVSLPLLPDRLLRVVLVVDQDVERAQALLCANSAAVSDAQAVEFLEAFVIALEQPLALMA